jgi:hypothetical protein
MYVCGCIDRDIEIANCHLNYCTFVLGLDAADGLVMEI